MVTVLKGSRSWCFQAGRPPLQPGPRRLQADGVPRPHAGPPLASPKPPPRTPSCPGPARPLGRVPTGGLCSEGQDSGGRRALREGVPTAHHRDVLEAAELHTAQTWLRARPPGPCICDVSHDDDQTTPQGRFSSQTAKHSRTSSTSARENLYGHGEKRGTDRVVVQHRWTAAERESPEVQGVQMGGERGPRSHRASGEAGGRRGESAPHTSPQSNSQRCFSTAEGEEQGVGG